MCGHKTKLIRKIEVFGEQCVWEQSRKKLEYCCECFAGMTIRCAWCGKPILIGDSVTLYFPKPEFVIPEYAVRYKEKQVVGCLRWDCGDSGIDRAGFWVLPGKVERVFSPTEEVMLGVSNRRVFNDISDFSQAIKVPEKWQG